MSAHLTVYLAGAVDQNPWRAKVIKECEGLDITFLSPHDNVSYNFQGLIPAQNKRPAFHLVDGLKVDRADIVFAYLDKDSQSAFSGTSWELGRAGANGKITFVINNMPAGKACKYELVKRAASMYFSKLEEAIDVLKDMSEEMGYKPNGAEEKNEKV